MHCCLHIRRVPSLRLFPFFFFNDKATTEIYTLSLHDALPIFSGLRFDPRIAEVAHRRGVPLILMHMRGEPATMQKDRKSTRLNSSHQIISYAVFCLKKKKNQYNNLSTQ